MIKFKHKGNFEKSLKFLNRAKLQSPIIKVLEKYGQDGVKVLSSSTPVDTGLTANSWGYRIEVSNSRYKLIWTNSNIKDGVSIAVILQYGHGTGSGGWVEGLDYINPAIRPIFDKIANDAWVEVTNG